MPKAIMISIQPKWVEKILNGEKTIEIRKTMPKCGFPIDVYIYCTKAEPYLYGCFGENEIGGGFGYTTSYCPTEDENSLDRTENLNGKVVAKFTLNEITELRKMEHYKATGLVLYKGAMNMGEFNKYGGKYAWQIENLKIFDEPKELSEFTYRCVDDSKCENCPYYYYHNTESDSEKGCSCDCRKPITKAPQSWQFVEVE